MALVATCRNSGERGHLHFCSASLSSKGRVSAERSCFLASGAPARDFLSRTSIFRPPIFSAVLPCLEKGNAMESGVVKWFNAQKGFGFIQPESGGQDVFVHISAVERAGLRGLAEGQKINYEIMIDRRSGKSSADQLQVAD
jgi:CspA family cold shock protein